MTLVETVVALGLLVICGISGFYAFMLINRYAARERNMSSAKALCQERIEQALTTPFRPPLVLPNVTGQDSKTYSILGTAANYTTAGVYTGAETFTEAVTVYVQQDPTSATAVPGTRTTTVVPSLLTDSSGLGSLGMVQFTVTVAYTVNGDNRTYKMNTMRGTD